MGDEDLLEIIGNSKNVPKLQKHFKKMFAGVASVILNDDNTQVLGVCSREGEQVSQDPHSCSKRNFVVGYVDINSLYSKLQLCIVG